MSAVLTALSDLVVWLLAGSRAWSLSALVLLLVGLTLSGVAGRILLWFETVCARN